MTTKFSVFVLFCVAMVLPAVSKTAEADDLRKQAERGDATAQYNLGMRYAMGWGGYPKDDAEAVRWFRLSAEQGDASAQAWLGDIYASGQGVPKNDAEAVKWYRLSAEQGDASAQNNLGVMYGNGTGVPKDLVLAYKWYNLSASRGNENATKNRGTIEKEMTRSQIEEAQRLSREWFAEHQYTVIPKVIEERIDGTGNIGLIAHRALKTEYGEYLNRIIDTVDIQWNRNQRLNMREGLDAPLDGSRVKVEFFLHQNGSVSISNVEGSAGDLWNRVATESITKQSPYEVWTNEMVQVLGEKTALTFTFHY